MANYEKTQKKVERYDALLLEMEKRIRELKSRRKECVKRAVGERLTSRGQLLEEFLENAPEMSNEEIAALLEKAFGPRKASEKKAECTVSLNHLTGNGTNDSAKAAPALA